MIGRLTYSRWIIGPADPRCCLHFQCTAAARQIHVSLSLNPTQCPSLSPGRPRLGLGGRMASESSLASMGSDPSRIGSQWHPSLSEWRWHGFPALHTSRGVSAPTIPRPALDPSAAGLASPSPRSVLRRSPATRDPPANPLILLSLSQEIRECKPAAVTAGLFSTIFTVAQS